MARSATHLLSTIQPDAFSAHRWFIRRTFPNQKQLPPLPGSHVVFSWQPQMSWVKFSSCGQWPVRPLLPAGYLPILKSGSQTRSPVVLHWAHPYCPLESHWVTSQGRDSDDWQRKPFCQGWLRGVVIEGMCNRTGCRAASGGEAQRNPAVWGWIDSQVEKHGEAENKILRLHTQMALWERGRPPRGCYNGGEGGWGGCRRSQAGWEGKPGRVRSRGTWRAGEKMVRFHHEVLG